jgi:hypothetical protein
MKSWREVCEMWISIVLVVAVEAAVIGVGYFLLGCTDYQDND